MSKSPFQRLRESLSFHNILHRTSRGPHTRRRLSFESLEGRQLLAVSSLSDFGGSSDTGEKPQSKVWEYDDQWYAAMPDDGMWIWKLNGNQWQQHLQISTDGGYTADVKVVGNLAHIFLFDGQNSRLATIEYDHGPDNRYEMWSLRPSLVDVSVSGSAETAVIDVDTTGRMWVAYDASSAIEVRYADLGSQYTNWSAPITVASGIKSDDIGSLIAMPNGTIGVLWSNQNADRFGFRIHVDGAAPGTWLTPEVPANQSAQNKGGGMADDHINLAVASDGTVYAAVKTSYDSSGYPRIALLVRRPSGVWDNLYQVDTVGTRPIVMLNEAAGKLIVAYTQSNGGGNIYFKESSMHTISFGGRQTLISSSVNNASSVKGNFTDDLVVIAGGGGEAKSALFRFDGPVVAPPPPQNQAPNVNAGSDRTIQLPAGVALDGTVTDDGNPVGGSLTTSWSTISGPGTVTFTNASAIGTTATFSVAGTYVLRLTANDGSLPASDTVTIVVQAAAPVNQAPNVNAGIDRTIQLPAGVALDGTVTDDGNPIGGSLSTSWSIVSGPGTVTFANTNAIDTTATFSVAGTYVLRLTASDGSLQDSDTVTIVVQAVSAPPVNQVPSVSAGPDRSIVLGNAASLDGTVSDDGLPAAPGTITRTWSKVSGPGTVTFGNASAIDTTATFSVAGTYVLRLTASDGLLSAFDEMTVTVASNNAPTTVSFQDGVFPAITYQGTRDTKITSGSKNTNYGNATSLDLDGSPDVSNLMYWDVAAIPAGSTIDSASIQLNITNTSKSTYEVYEMLRSWNELTATWNQTAAGAAWATAGATGATDRGSTVLGTISATSNGLYQLVLNANGIAVVQNWINDPSANNGLIFQDYANSNGADFTSSEASTATQRPKLTVTYRAANSEGGGNEGEEDESPPAPENQAPVVNAGTDQSIQLPNTVSLSGTVADDGLPSSGTVTQAWTSVSGPGTVTFGNASNASATATFSTAGTYVLRLTASDGSLQSFDEVTINVQAAAPVNQAPVVNAGADQSIQLPSTVSLSGTVTDDGLPSPGVLTRSWTRISGPGTVTFGNASNASTTASFSTAGTYVLRLTASDGTLQSFDEVTITALAVPVNQAPTVNAGSNQTIQLPAVANLAATVTDTGGPLTTPLLLWTRVSGPGTVTFGDAAAASTTAEFSEAGTFVLRLTANDGEFESFDEITVTVEAAATQTKAQKLLDARRSLRG